MKFAYYALTTIAIATSASAFVPEVGRDTPRILRVVDTVYIERKSPEPIDYEKIVSLVVNRMRTAAPNPTVIEGDLIVNGRLGIRGAPEPQTDHAVTIHGKGSADILFVSNEALQDPQRASNQHRHVGTIGVAQDGGLRLGQNSLCYTDTRGCAVDDKNRRLAYAGYDSMGDMSFYLADVDSLSGAIKAPAAQNLVLGLQAWDGNIHISSLRPNQKIIFNGSTTLNAADLAWEVPLRGSQ